MTNERARQVTWADPMSIAGAASGRTGLAFLRGIRDGAIAAAPIQATLGFDLVTVEDGFVRFRMVTGEHLCNPMGTVHGGVACVLLDSAMSSSVLSQLDEKTAYTTVDLAVHLTRPIRPNTGEIFAEGRVVHRGSRVATAEGKLLDAHGRLLAHGTTTCLIVERANDR
jgi:uncharacterized protein (TIGR00369 family)